MGLPTKDQKKFLAKPYEADAIDFFPHTVTIHVGDSVKFLPTPFHNVDIPAKGGKPLALLPLGAPRAPPARAAGGRPHGRRRRRPPSRSGSTASGPPSSSTR